MNLQKSIRLFNSEILEYNEFFLSDEQLDVINNNLYIGDDDEHTNKPYIIPFIQYFTLFNRSENENIYLLYSPKRGLKLFETFTELVFSFQEDFYETPRCPIVNMRHITSTVRLMEKNREDENICKFDEIGLKIGHIETNYISIQNKSVVHDYQYLFVFPESYSILFYERGLGYKIYNGKTENLIRYKNTFS